MQRNVVAAVQQLQGMWPLGQPQAGGPHQPLVQHAFPGPGAFPFGFPLNGPPPPPPPPPEGVPCVVSYNILENRASPHLQQSSLVDSGASVHLVNSMDLLHYPTVHATPIPLHLATSDATGGIVATGSVCLLSPNNVPLWLHHVQCVPSAIFNILSVSVALRDGAVKHFCFRRDLQSSTAAVVSGPWEKHFHPTTPGHKAHSTFWQQRLAKYTNILRTSLTNGVAISKSY
jgi:hypothetical protein